MKRIFLLATMCALPASAGFAAIDTDGLISRFQGEGYTTIEVTRGLDETKVEAIRTNEKVEVIFDNATGAVLETEYGAPDANDDTRPGVNVRDRARNFARNGDEDESAAVDRDDDNADDSEDDREDGRDDDRGGDDNGDDDRGGDDHGGDNNGGDGNGGGDDRGGDDD